MLKRTPLISFQYCKYRALALILQDWCNLDVIAVTRLFNKQALITRPSFSW